MRIPRAVYIYNLGTGHGYSVLDMIHAFSRAVGKEIPYVIRPRRAGDIATCYADAAKAKEELGWEAKTRDRRYVCRWMEMAVHESQRVQRSIKEKQGHREVSHGLFMEGLT